MQLLLVAEQRVLLQKVTSLDEPTLHLQPLKTEDGLVNITAVLTVTLPQQSQNQYYDGYSQRNYAQQRAGHKKNKSSSFEKTTVSLCLGSRNAEPTLVHCKLVVSDRWNCQIDNLIPPQTQEVEAREVLEPGSTTVSSVLQLQFDHPFEEVIILFRVYDIVDGRPASGVVQRLNKARLEGSSSCDVKLVVDGVELDAHRAVLAERSPVLNRMLTTGFKEAREGRVEVVDFPRAAIEKFLEYLYTDRVEDFDGWDVALLRLGDKYEVPELTDYCVLGLWTCSPPRALEVLNATGVSDIVSSQLRRRLTTIVVGSMPELGRTPEWAAFKKNHPALVDIMLGTAACSRESSCSMWSQHHPAAHTDTSK